MSETVPVADPVADPAPEFDPIKAGVDVVEEAATLIPGGAALVEEVSSHGALIQDIINFLHWLFPNHNPPGSPKV